MFTCVFLHSLHDYVWYGIYDSREGHVCFYVLWLTRAWPACEVGRTWVYQNPPLPLCEQSTLHVLVREPELFFGNLFRTLETLMPMSSTQFHIFIISVAFALVAREKFHDPKQGAAVLKFGPNMILDYGGDTSDSSVAVHYSVPQYIRCDVNRLDKDILILTTNQKVWYPH